MRLWTRFSKARQPRELIDWPVGICNRILVCQNPKSPVQQVHRDVFAVTGGEETV